MLGGRVTVHTCLHTMKLSLVSNLIYFKPNNCKSILYTHMLLFLTIMSEILIKILVHVAKPWSSIRNVLVISFY